MCVCVCARYRHCLESRRTDEPRGATVNAFYPRDAMLAAMALCLSVCYKSSSIETVERIELVFGSIVKMCYQLILLSTYLEKGGRSERDKLNRRQSAKLTVPPSSNAPPLVYHSNHQALSTAQFCCAGQLATSDLFLQSLVL